MFVPNLNLVSVIGLVFIGLAVLWFLFTPVMFLKKKLVGTFWLGIVGLAFLFGVNFFIDVFKDFYYTVVFIAVVVLGLFIWYWRSRR